MASFRARVVFLSLGMIMLICIQIYRTHFDSAPIFYDSQESIDVISKREASSRRHPVLKSQILKLNEGALETLQATVKSTDVSDSKDSEQSFEQNSDEGNYDGVEYPLQPVKKLQHASHYSNKRASFIDLQKPVNRTKSRSGLPENLLDDKNAGNNSIGRRNRHSKPNTQEILQQRLPEAQFKTKQEQTRTAAASSPSWFDTGELGLDYDYYNISWRRLTPITDNITLDISRYMNGQPVYRAPILAHDPYLCDVGGAGLYLLIIIPSLPRHHEIRSVIRETWASPVYNGGFWAGRRLNETIRLTFIFGASNYSDDDKAILRREMRQYGDILVMDFVDSYQNLSTKMANSYYWSGKHCRGVRHVLKVDEDTYVHVPQLINMIKRVEQITERFMLGHAHNHHYPKVVRKGKWRVGLEYPLPYYPRYIYGHSYVVSGAALPDLVRALKTTPGIKNEDAFITGIIAKLTDIPRFHTRAFAGTSFHQVLCNVTRGYYVSLTFCCKEHLRLLYRHAVEGKCEMMMFHQIPTWKCRFFKNDYYKWLKQRQEKGQLEDNHTDKEERKKHVKKLLVDLGSGLIGDLSKKYMKEGEAESEEVKNMKIESAEVNEKHVQTETDKLQRNKVKEKQETSRG